jgi:hypothetical protein
MDSLVAAARALAVGDASTYARGLDALWGMSTAPPRDATRPVSGGAATTSTPIGVTRLVDSSAARWESSNPYRDRGAK